MMNPTKAAIRYAVRLHLRDRVQAIIELAHLRRQPEKHHSDFSRAVRDTIEILEEVAAWARPATWSLVQPVHRSRVQCGGQEAAEARSMIGDLVFWECPICGYQVTDSHHTYVKPWAMCIACERVRVADFVEVRMPPGPAHLMLKDRRAP